MIVTSVPQIPGRYAFKDFTVAEQDRFRAYVTSRYLESCWSIRDLAVATGGSYGFIHKILVDAGVELRPPGTPRARTGWAEPDTPTGESTETAPTKQIPPPPFLIPKVRPGRRLNLTSEQRWLLREYCAARYMDDEMSVREIIALTGGTFPYVHGLLVEAGVPMRSKGGSKPGRTASTSRSREPGGAC